MLQGYYPEMKQPRPVANIEARLAHYGRHYFLTTPLVLKGRGIKHLETLTADKLTPQAQHKVGWNEYKVTDAAFETLCQQHDIVIAMML